jgi:hypothetical protein
VLNTIYTSNSYNFEYVALVTGTPNVSPRLSELNLHWTPTCYFDAGDETLVGGYSSPSVYTSRLNTCGAREVPDIDFSVSLTYNAKGTITVQVDATLNTYINLSPNKPSAPAGPTMGTLETPYTYTTSTTDPDGDQVYYMWDWGDGTFSDWLGPYDSGEEASAEHSWDYSDNFQIRAKAKDGDNAESEWSSVKWAYFEGYPYVCGDANGDQSVNVSDAVYIINYVFITGSPAPDPLEAADSNCDGSVNVSDAVYIINYVFITGSPSPCDPSNDGVPDC